jgi:hypothetical protein
VGSGLGITRGPKQLRAAAPERIGLGFQLRIVTAFTHLDTDQVLAESKIDPQLGRR